MKTVSRSFSACLLLVMLAGCSGMSGMSAVSSLANNELVQSLVKQVGASVPQAVGGSGALLNLAQGKLPATDFSKLSNVVPGMKDIMEQGKSLAGFSGNLNSMADAKEVMSKLGMSSNQTAQMPQALAGYVESKGGSDMAGLLRNIWK